MSGGGVSGGSILVDYNTVDKQYLDLTDYEQYSRRSKTTAFSGVVEHNVQPSGGISSSNGQIIMSDDVIM